MIDGMEAKLEQVLDLAEEMIRALNAEQKVLNEGILAVETEAGQYILQRGSGVVTDLVIHDYQKRIFDLEGEKWKKKFAKVQKPSTEQFENCNQNALARG